MNGVDYYSANHCLIESRKSTPYEAGLGWTVNLDRDPFVRPGDALRPRRQRGPARTGTSSASRSTGTSSRRCFARYGLPPRRSAASAWRDPVPVYAAEAQAGRLGDERRVVAHAQEEPRARDGRARRTPTSATRAAASR